MTRRASQGDPTGGATIDPPEPPENDTPPLDGMPDPPPADTADTADPDAPYGRKADGSPRGRPGRKPGSASGAAPAPRSRGRRTGGARPSSADRVAGYRQTIAELIDVPAGLLAGAGAASGSVALQADAIVVNAFKHRLADQTAAVAATKPAFAAWLERLSDVSPVMLLGMTVGTMAAQILVNHKAIPAGILSTVPAEAIVAAVTGQPVSQERAAA